MAEELAGLVTEAEAGLVADFDFMGERARIDDLALTLHCARTDLEGEGGLAGELARLGRLVASYDAHLEVPLSAAERAALPVWRPSWRRHGSS